MSSSLRSYDWISHHRSLRGDRIALRDLDTGRAFTYSQLDTRTDQLMRHLRAQGIGRGDRVAILAHNGPEFFELQFACWRLGAIAVLLNWRLTVAELEYILNDSSPKVLLHSADFASTARELQTLCKVDGLLALGADYEAALTNATGDATPEETTHDDAVTIMYTSGTTGHPKGAIITQGMLFWNAINLGVPSRVSSRTKQLVILPLFHTGGLNCYANPVLHAGGEVLIMKTFDAALALKYVGDRTLGITHFFGVPAPYQFMMQHPDFESTDLSRLEMAGVGGAPCALTILETWAERGVNLVQGFGMTETSPASIFMDPDDALRKIGSAGKPVMHTSVRIVDDEGNDVAPGSIGELWTKGPNITPGYWNKPEATASSFHDGWLKTGDAARVDDEGFVYIVDRWKDMYISGGENVYPAEVENVIYQLPAVAEAAIIGVPNPKWGEVGMAVIVVKPGQSLEARSVIEHCVGRLAKFKVPAEVRFIDALPRNATGKVLKRELRTQFIGSDAPAIS